MVGAFAPDASEKSDAKDARTAVIRHPGGTSPGGGGSARVHLYIVKTVSDLGATAITVKRDESRAPLDHNHHGKSVLSTLENGGMATLVDPVDNAKAKPSTLREKSDNTKNPTTDILNGRPPVEKTGEKHVEMETPKQKEGKSKPLSTHNRIENRGDATLDATCEIMTKTECEISLERVRSLENSRGR